MNDSSSTATGETTWEEILDRAKGRTTMLVGGPGSGKTRLAHWLVSRMASVPGLVALISTDVGQQSVGVPTCLGLALGEPRERAAALWFVGDVAPTGNLLPMVVGTARLVERARTAGAESIVIDTTGLIGVPLGCLLKYHKILAAGVDFVVAIQRSSELEAMLGVLAGICPLIDRIRPAAEARDRTPAERRAYREDRYRACFRDADVLTLPLDRLIACGWALDTGSRLPRGRIVGLLDENGFCLDLGLVEDVGSGTLTVHTPWKRPEAVRRIQEGRISLDRHAEFREMESPAP